MIQLPTAATRTVNLPGAQPIVDLCCTLVDSELAARMPSVSAMASPSRVHQQCSSAWTTRPYKGRVFHFYQPDGLASVPTGSGSWQLVPHNLPL